MRKGRQMKGRQRTFFLKKGTKELNSITFRTPLVKILVWDYFINIIPFWQPCCLHLISSCYYDSGRAGHCEELAMKFSCTLGWCYHGMKLQSSIKQERKKEKEWNKQRMKPVQSTHLYCRGTKEWAIWRSVEILEVLLEIINQQPLR